MEGLRKSEADMMVYVHPSNAADVRCAVARQISSLLFSYEDHFDGVLLAHEFAIGVTNDKKGKEENTGKEDNRGKEDNMDNQKNIKAKTLNGLVPYFGVPVQASLLLFSPQPNMMLEGMVEMLGKESINATVLGVFSAAIMSDDIHEKVQIQKSKISCLLLMKKMWNGPEIIERLMVCNNPSALADFLQISVLCGLLNTTNQPVTKELVYAKGDGGRFVSRSDKHHVIEKGSMVRFSVKRVDAEMNCHITGSLIPPHTGSMLWLSLHDGKYASGINSDKRRSRDTNIKVEQDEQEYGEVNNKNGVRNSERPHESRKRSFEERY